MGYGIVEDYEKTVYGQVAAGSIKPLFHFSFETEDINRVRSDPLDAYIVAYTYEHAQIILERSWQPDNKRVIISSAGQVAPHVDAVQKEILDRNEMPIIPAAPEDVPVPMVNGKLQPGRSNRPRNQTTKSKPIQLGGIR